MVVYVHGRDALMRLRFKNIQRKRRKNNEKK